MDSAEIFQLLCEKLFNKKFPIPKEFIEYKIALEICRNIEGITPHKKLLITLFEEIFLDKGTPKKEIDANLLKCFKLCLKNKLDDSFLTFFVAQKEKELLDNLKNPKIFSKIDFRLLAFLMKVKTDFGLLFKCFEDIYIEKCEKYIPVKNKKIFLVLVHLIKYYMNFLIFIIC